MSERTRREFLRDATILGAGITTSKIVNDKLLPTGAHSESPAAPPRAAAAPGTVELSLLGGTPPNTPTGISWGVPWPQGAVKRGATFSLNAHGADLPVQTWPLAYWPDGSMKWSGFATVVPAGITSPITLSPGSSTAKGALSVAKNGNAIAVDTGAMKCAISISGANIIDSISIGGKVVTGASQLVCILQNGPETESTDAPPREKYFKRRKENDSRAVRPSSRRSIDRRHAPRRHISP